MLGYSHGQTLSQTALKNLVTNKVDTSMLQWTKSVQTGRQDTKAEGSRKADGGDQEDQEEQEVKKN